MNQRNGLLALIFVALAACSTSGNNATLTNPLAGVTIIQPTVTPVTPSPTPTATPTPVPSGVVTPTPGPTDVIVDGGFEAEGAAMSFSSWQPCSYAVPGKYGTAPITSDISAYLISAGDPAFTVSATAPVTVMPSPHLGTYGVLTFSGGGASTVYPSPNPSASPVAGEDGICQTFALPKAAVLNLYVEEGGHESTGYGDQEATIFAGPNTTSSPIPIFSELNVQAGGGTGPATNGYVLRGPYDLLSPKYGLTAGETVTLYIGTYDNGPSSTYGPYMFVDDVSVIGTPVSSSTIRRKVR